MNTIIERVQKLLALAESSNVHEAAAAAAMAQKLITKHKLSTAELSAEHDDSNDEPVDDVEAFETKSFIPWKSVLFNGLAIVNDCETYRERTHRRGKQVGVSNRIIGTQSSISTVKYMFEYLVREIDRLAAERREMGRSWLRDFRIGAADEVVSRLKDAVKQVVEEVQPSSTALAVVNREREGVQRIYAALNLRKAPSLNVRSSTAIAEGRAAGRKIRLDSGPALGKGDSGRLR